jgi:hypothetical protein
MAQSTSQLLTRPVEIRDLIYTAIFSGREDAFVDPVLAGEHCKLCTGEDEYRVVTTDSYLIPSPREAQLLRVCWQIFREAQVVLVRETNFIVSPRADILGLFRNGWLRQPVYNHIRKLELRLQEDQSPLYETPEHFIALEHLEIVTHSTEWEMRNKNATKIQREQNLKDQANDLWEECGTIWLKYSLTHLVDVSSGKEIRFILCNKIDKSWKVRHAFPTPKRRDPLTASCSGRKLCRRERTRWSLEIAACQNRRANQEDKAGYGGATGTCRRPVPIFIVW